VASISVAAAAAEEVEEVEEVSPGAPTMKIPLSEDRLPLVADQA
jgi:hypothetical protein